MEIRKVASARIFQKSFALRISGKYLFNKIVIYDVPEGKYTLKMNEEFICAGQKLAKYNSNLCHYEFNIASNKSSAITKYVNLSKNNPCANDLGLNWQQNNWIDSQLATVFIYYEPKQTFINPYVSVKIYGYIWDPIDSVYLQKDSLIKVYRNIYKFVAYPGYTESIDFVLESDLDVHSENPECMWMLWYDGILQHTRILDIRRGPQHISIPINMDIYTQVNHVEFVLRNCKLLEAHQKYIPESSNKNINI